MPMMVATYPPERAAVTVRGLDADMVAALGRHVEAGNAWQFVLSVRVVEASTVDHDLPPVSGRHRLLADGVEFLPHFPFEAGTHYRSHFEPPRDPAFDECPILSLDIRTPSVVNPPPHVVSVHPSGGQVPENVLRFYVTFSEPMQRGRAEDHIVVLGPDGGPLPDALYRAPVELWNHDMRRLTVLMDPGRLKRQLGPNHRLGPPLQAGLDYALAIGTGMTDQMGQRLTAPHRNHFRATPAVRRRVDILEWLRRTPSAHEADALILDFPRPLDWAMLSHAIGLDRTDGRRVAGRPEAGRGGSQWRFVPAEPWEPGDYRVLVSPQLEDVCGNDLMAPFDRDVGCDSPRSENPVAIPFRIS